ncbi:MAG TPA: hypothetical protein VH643_09150 [Gemmataceae bacterium]|jgi:RNA polymerase sigma factor (sigma-70 family)
MIRLARKICKEDFPKLRLVEEEVQYQTWKAAKHAFRYFNPEVGQQSIPVQRRFFLLFRDQFLKQLRKENRRWRRTMEKRLNAELEAFEHPPKLETVDAAVGEEWRLWSQRLLREALKRVDQRTCTIIQLRQGGMTVRAIARRLRVSPKTVSNRYSPTRIGELVGREVGRLVLALPAGHLQGIVAHLHHEVGLAPTRIAQLLCLPPEALTEPLRRACAGIVPIRGREDALKLLDAALPRRRAAKLERILS